MSDNIKKYLVRIPMVLVGILPLCVHRFNAIWLGWLVEHVFRYRVRLVDDNLSHAFPEKSEAELLALRHSFYRHFATVFAEALWIAGCVGPWKNRCRRILEVGDNSALKTARETRPGVIIMSAHTGNWEAIPGIFRLEYGMGFPEEFYCITYRRLSSKVMDDVMRINRLSLLLHPEVFDGYLESKEVLRYVYKHLGVSKAYNFIMDQRPYFNLENSRKMTFMNRECYVMDASAVLAAKLGFAVVYQHMFKRPQGGYRMEFELIASDASSMKPEDIMRKYYDLLEEDIRKQPENYLWTHNRWWMGEKPSDR